jgi:hypothetical protein
MILVVVLCSLVARRVVSCRAQNVAEHCYESLFNYHIEPLAKNSHEFRTILKVPPTYPYQLVRQPDATRA